MATITAAAAVFRIAATAAAATLKGFAAAGPAEDLTWGGEVLMWGGEALQW